MKICFAVIRLFAVQKLHKSFFYIKVLLMNKMKIQTECPNLFGKIKLWHHPIFDLSIMRKNLALFRSVLESKLELKINAPFIKPPDPRTVLGRKHPTIRFEHIVPYIKTDVQNENPLSFLDHIDLGFGESGYYFDLYLSISNLSIDNITETNEVLFKFIQNFENIIEFNLNEFQLGPIKDDNQKWEISNLDITVLDEDQDLIKKFDFLNSLLEIVNNNSEVIIRNSINIPIPEIRLKWHSELLFKDRYLFNRSEKYLENNRYLHIVPCKPNMNSWNINSRGLTIDGVFNLLKILF